ncbi:MAG: hypothetical protein EXS42_03080 [Lacunisphaera sp.]|nr:hypothetical protein [Lacunisphaera sp.]
MPLRLCRLCLLAATVVVAAWAQTAIPAPAVTAPRIPAPKSIGKTARPLKTGVPDPDLLDGSAFEQEKRPLHGMLSEIEMGEKEGPKGAKVSPDSGPAGSQSASAEKNEATRGAGGNAQAEPQSNQQQGGDGPIAEGPAAEAQGTQVANLKVPEGAQAAGGTQSTAPRDLQIGDATLQIQTLDKNAPNVVGVESSSSQQFEKKLPAGGQQTDYRNRGVEKGRVVPKGL